jgi:parallel beta-helix repeat protein
MYVNLIKTKNYSLMLIITLVIFSCKKNELNTVASNNEEVENIPSSTYGKGVVAYSAVELADLPVIDNKKFYPVTDDAKGINAAIIEASIAGGGTVKLTSMTYQIDAHITLKSKVRLLGNGMGKTILKRSPKFQTINDDYFIGADDGALRDVEISSITLDGNYSRLELAKNPTPFIGIRISSALDYYNERIRVVFCDISGFVMGIHMKGTTHITVQNSSIHDNGATNLDHNIYFRRIGHVLIYKNEIYDAVGGSGLKFAGGTAYVSNESRHMIIRDNNINNNERINLNIQGCDYLLIEGNELQRQNSKVEAMAGMFLKAYNGYQCQYTDIINNSIIDNTNNGIYVDSCKDFNIEGNSCSNNGTNYNITNSSLFKCDYNN